MSNIIEQIEAEQMTRQLPEFAPGDTIIVQVKVKEGTRERHQGRGTLDMLYVNGDVANTSGSAGESAGLIHEIKSVREIVDDTIAGFWREIDRLAALRPQAGERRVG